MTEWSGLKSCPKTTGADAAHGPWLEVLQNGAGHVIASAGLLNDEVVWPEALDTLVSAGAVHGPWFGVHHKDTRGFWCGVFWGGCLN